MLKYIVKPSSVTRKEIEHVLNELRVVTKTDLEGIVVNYLPK